MSDPVSILLIDDNPLDARLLEMAMREYAMPCGLYHSADGREGASAARGECGDCPRPDLILLDIKMPGVDGFEVLTWLKEHPATRAIPVVMYTSMHASEATEVWRERGAEALFTKPIDLAGYGRLFETMAGILGQPSFIPGGGPGGGPGGPAGGSMPSTPTPFAT